MKFNTNVTLGLQQPLDPPLMNGGGCAKKLEDVLELAKSLAGAIVLGSITLKARDGNSGDVWWHAGSYALNSLGMPNGGADYLKLHLLEMVKITHDYNKPLIVNVAGETPREYAELASLAFDHGADAVELNLGCPNVITKDGGRKPIPSYDPDAFMAILQAIDDFDPGENQPIWVKVSPNPINDMVSKLAQITGECDFIKAVTATNTFPNSYALNANDGKPKITVGLAGMSGPGLKPIALGQVMQWRETLSENISVIGVGGISKGEDIAEFDIAGADAFQVTSELLKSGKLNAYALERIVADYLDIEYYPPGSTYN